MSRRKLRPKQLELTGTQRRAAPTHGGYRPGAGRKRIHDELIAHRRRPAVSPRIPVHVTVRMAERVWNLRSERSFKIIERALFSTANRPGARFVHFSVQGSHMHMLVEASDARALSSAMRSLGIRIGRGLNQLMGSAGKVIDHRYHARSLRTPTEVYRALSYVRRNHDHHRAQRGRRPLREVDRFCSDALLTFAPPSPTTWLLREGWRRGAPRPARLDAP